ncbi:hypothetical protein [Pedobacter rhizosphaerae]|uniref:Uncharacterized protein n=1 Tax=Pedobacter rhizosphaerae TaxID=390241 RepID=A0A1H9W6Q9_9SPHI|nr:hypothetical protein [Pedobacter rhizosphaerae]SES29612.1 hypothetical protein SAMN04488023_16014 [Pedobacter rhizosphaerae]
MKIRSIIIVSLFASQSLLAQNTFPTSGRTGINTLTPAGNFQIMGDGGFDGSTTLFLTNNSSDYGRTSLVLTGRLQDQNDGWTFGSGARNAITFAQNYASSGLKVGDLGEQQYAIQLEGNSNSLGFLSKGRGNLPNMVLTQAGKIGLGTPSPRAFLDVANYCNDLQLSCVLGRLEEGDATGDGTFLGVRGYNTTNNYDRKSFALEHSFYGVINSSINFYRGGSITGGGISFNTNANEEKMRIDIYGNVGIGTSAPKEKLSVNGNIRSKEVKVETANWPDYVFSIDYPLQSLAEVQRFIKDNGHLPDMPSAQEAETNGIALGEMNKKLLQKIEELTLHLIDKDKQLSTQQSELQILKDALSEQGKIINEIQNKIK